ncbi:hypothetical protein ACW23B_25615 [Streptomyces albidoflavus]
MRAPGRGPGAGPGHSGQDRDELAGPALLLAGSALTGSPATGALLLAALTVPAVLGGTAVGVLLDRAPRPGRLLAAGAALLS